MTLQELRRGIQIQQGKDAHDLIIKSGLTADDLIPLIEEDLESYPIHAVDYYKASLISKERARDWYNETSFRHAVAFYEAHLISLEEARQGLDHMQDKYGKGHLVHLYKAGIITLQEIAPFSRFIFFNHSYQREELLDLKLIEQELYDEYEKPMKATEDKLTYQEEEDIAF